MNMRLKIFIVAIAAMLGECITSGGEHQKIVGTWECDETSRDIGLVHHVWTFSPDGKIEFVAWVDKGIDKGEGKLQMQGSYTLTATNLTVTVAPQGSQSYGVEYLNDNSMQLRELREKGNVIKLTKTKEAK